MDQKRLLTGCRVSVPVFWESSTTQSFVEIPISHPRIRSIELQQLHRNGSSGCIVELHLRSDQLEIYAEPTLRLDESWFRSDPPFAHFDLALLQQTNFAEIRCDVARGTIQAGAVFNDSMGNKIEVQVSLQTTRPVEPLFTPAPLQRDPKTLRFLLTNEFRLLPTHATSVAITVNGSSIQPSPFLVPLPRLAPYLQARSGTEMLLVGLNPAHCQRRLSTAGPGRTTLDRCTSVNVDAEGLQSLRSTNDHGWFQASFQPSLPSPDALEEGATCRGGMTVTSPIGQVATSKWSMLRARDEVAFQLNDVDQDWNPGFRPTFLALRHLRRYRRRKHHWHYHALLNRQKDGAWASTGSWSIDVAG